MNSELMTHSAAFSTRIIDWLRGKGPILIVTHDHPDPDSLAAAYAFRHLILVKTNQEATIAFGGGIGRGENRAMVRELDIPAVCLDRIDLDNYPVVCMVDCQPGTGNSSFPADRRVDLVIDHHALREATQECKWVDVRPEYGAAATILFEYLQAQQVSIATKLATILFYAIKSETQGLGRDWNKADRAAYLELVPLCNNRILYAITVPKSPRSYFKDVVNGLRNARVYGDVLVFNVYDVDHPEIVAEIADLLMRTEGVDTVLGIGRYREEGVLSMRTNNPQINAGALIREITVDLGTAGGHSMIAGGQIRPMPADRAGQVAIETTLINRLFKSLQRELPAPSSLTEE